MQKAALRAQEAKTLDLLHELEILDTADETEFDGLVKAASRIFGAPIALVSLVAEDRQWFKSKVGISIAESPRDTAFCAHAVLQQDVFEVPDTLEDLRFADNPLVIGPPGIRFYAGAPLSIADGLQIGTLCILDTVPRQLTSEERELLRNLATAVVHAIELRFAKRRLSAIKSKVNPTQTSTSRLMVDAMDLVESAVAQIFEPGEDVPSVPSSNLMGLTDDEHAEADAPTRAAYQAKPAMTHALLSDGVFGIAGHRARAAGFRTVQNAGGTRAGVEAARDGHQDCWPGSLSRRPRVGRSRRKQGTDMKNGIYETTFTTNLGTLGNAAVLVKDGTFVGADDMNFFRGEIDRLGDDVRVIMEVTRHTFSRESAFGNAHLFTLTWIGRELDESTFRLSCQPEGVDVSIYVTGRLLTQAD